MCFLYRLTKGATQPPSASPQALSVKLLVQAVSNVSDWHSLGLRLDLTMSQLNNVHITYHMHEIERIKAEMFCIWLKSSPNATWADLIRALKAMGEVRVASEIEAEKSLTTGNA